MKKIFILTVLALIFTGVLITKSEAFSFNDMTLRFAQVSDVHLSDRASDTSYKLLSSSATLFRDAINQVNYQKTLDFVMFTGDMIDEPKESLELEFYKLANTLNPPYYTLLGNHDISQGNNNFTKERYLELARSHNKSFNFDKTYYSFSPKPDYKVIVLDMMIDKEPSTNGYIDPEQLKWLDEELNKSKNKIVLIFQHYPAIEPFSSEHHKLKNGEEFMNVIQKYKMPIAVLSGHYHTTKIVRQQNILFVSSPALITYPNAFRIVSITAYRDRAVFDFYFKETMLKNLQTKSKVGVLASSMFYGTDKDQNTTFIISRNGKEIKEK